MAKRVLFLIPAESMSNEDRICYSKLHPFIEFETADSYNPLEIIKRKVREGIEIIAGRGNTAFEARKHFPNLHVIEISITAYDVIRSFDMSDCHGKTVAVITNKADIIGLDIFAKHYNINILSYLLVPFDKLNRTLRTAMDKGADLVMGGTITCRAAREMGIPAVTFLLGPESMRGTIKEVEQVQATIEIETARQGFINKLMDNILEGVVAVDTSGAITAVNTIATRILGRPRHALVGEPLDGPIRDFHELAEPDQAEKMVAIRGNTVMLTRIPIMKGNTCFGTIFTIHESGKIANMENTIRKELYAKEHVVRYGFGDVLGKSPAIRQALEDARSFARTDSNILVTGESGSGKEVFAQGIHHESSRQDKPFVAVNCAALPNDLLQSELFGYAEGAFTGANRKGKVGLFEIAHGGTIFLDEISEMGYANQGNLLRVVQERYVVRLGSHKPIHIDTRIIAATNKNLTRLVQEGKFREDLYYRLNVLALEIPALRDRKNDIGLLMLYFLNSFPSPNRGGFILKPDAEACLEEYPWPGNIRELSNVAERIVATAKSPVIGRVQLQRAMQLPELTLPKVVQERMQARENRNRRQVEDIKRMLADCDGNLSEVARQLGVDRTTLWRRMKRQEA